MKFIAIEGRGGSGKTYLANALGARLGATVLHLDEYGSDYEPFIGIPKLIEALENQSGETVIFEGVGVFDSRFDKFDAFKIFVNTSQDVRRERAGQRDVPRGDRSAEEWKQIYAIWFDAENKYFTNALSAKATIVVDGSGEEELQQILQALRS